MALIIEVKVIPLAGRQAWKLEGERLKCYIKSAPQKGKANNEVRMLIAQALHLPTAKITIISGATTRIKKIKIDAPLSFDMVLKALHIEQQISLF